jgi:nucleotide-binding universal stress UspA family protein
MVVGHGIFLILTKGNAGEDIVEYAERNNVNTVIMGSGTDNAVRRVMLGSVGDYCSHNLACPVVIVKHP